MDVRRITACMAAVMTVAGAAGAAGAQPAAASEAYPEAQWADPTGSLLCAIRQADSESERSWKYVAHCTQLRVMNNRANKKMCRWNDWAGPVVGPMGGRWLCAHDPFSQPYVEQVPDSEDFWWVDQVGYRAVTGRYGFAKGSKLAAMPAGTQIKLGNITCLQGKSAVTCTDTRLRHSFTAYSSGKTTWKGVKGMARTWGDVQY